MTAHYSCCMHTEAESILPFFVSCNRVSSGLPPTVASRPCPPSHYFRTLFFFFVLLSCVALALCVAIFFVAGFCLSGYASQGNMDEQSVKLHGHMAAVIVYEAEYKGTRLLRGGYTGSIHDPDIPAVLVGLSWCTQQLYKDRLRGHVSCGGGPIALEDWQYAFKSGLNCLYIPTKARHLVTAKAWTSETARQSPLP